MAQDDRDRLNKLVELRNKGVLSEDEFRSARLRLLRTAETAEPSGSASVERRSFWQAWWPAIIGFALLILLIAAVFIYGHFAAQQDKYDLDVGTGEAGNSMATAEQAGTQLCAAEAGHRRVKDLLFERAQKQYGGDPGPLDSLGKSVGVRMQYPLVKGARQDVGTTVCGGHLVLDLPPSAHAAFDGLSALESDVEFAVRAGPDGAGNVIDVTGGDDLVQQLAVAASLVGGRTGAASGEPLAKSFTPSFDCKGALSNVERLICQDEELSALDRLVAGRYENLRRRIVADDWQVVADRQRAFLRRRAACADVACLNDAYVAQARVLEQFADMAGL